MSGRVGLAAVLGAVVVANGGALAQEGGPPAPGGVAPVDSAVAAVASQLVARVDADLAAQEALAADLDEAARELRALFEAALEAHASDPKVTEAAFARLPRSEQIAWRVAHLRGVKEALTRIYARISDEVEEERGVPPEERTSVNGLVLRYAVGHQRLLAGLRGSVEAGVALPAATAEQVELARAQWDVFARRFAPATFSPPRGRQGAAVPPAAFLGTDGFCASPAADRPVDSYTALLALPAGDVPARPEAHVPFTGDLLFELQGLIDPLERLTSALRLEQEQLELEQLRSVIASPPAVDGAAEAGTPGVPAVGSASAPASTEAALSGPARVSKAIERFTQYREVLVAALRESYQRYLQQGRELGRAITPEELLRDAPDLGPEVRVEVVRALELARGEVGPAAGPRLAEVQAGLEATVARWRAERLALDDQADASQRVRACVLTMQLRGKARRLEALRSTVRREESRLRVARKLLADALQRVVSVEQRIGGFDALWNQAALDHYGRSAVRVLAILLAAWVVLRLLAAASTRIVERLSAGSTRFTSDAEARLTTLQSVFVATLRVVVWVTAGLMVLAQFDVDYEPLLLATGGVTLAVGFGAQSLVKDFFSGFFILLENQFTVGDVIEADGKAGAVESVDLRTTRLRSADGTLHIIPNGQIAAVSNLTHTWARMNLLVSVALSEDPDEVVQTINRVGQEMFADPECAPLLLEAPHVWGLDAFGTNSLDFRVAGKTRPGDQWTVSREFRRRMKVAFDLAGIEIPYPYMNQVLVGDRPSKVLRRRRAAARPVAATPLGATTEADGPGIDPEADGHRMPG